MEQQNYHFRRKLLSAAIGNILLETGFDTTENIILESLTEILQCFIVELGNSCKNFCELAGRTEPVISDVILALVNMGIPCQGIEQHARRHNRLVLPPLQQTHPQKQFNMLQAGMKQPHHPHIFTHLPKFPDPHAYIRTPTHKQPVTEYEAIREKAASHKRDIERALTRFLAKTNETHNLFDSEDNHMFPLIACKANFPPYLNALLPQDQIFDPEDLEYEAQVETEPSRKKQKDDQNSSETTTQLNDNEVTIEEEKSQEENASNTLFIDNPYLAATKMPNKTGNE